MKIVFITEMKFRGSVDRKFENMRTEFAWMTALQAKHLPIDSFLNKDINLNTLGSYDLGVIIYPKRISQTLQSISLVENVRKVCTKVSFMQEGPSWYFQDLPLETSLWFLNEMQSCDFALAHNLCDKNYYRDLLQIPSYVNPTLIIEDLIKDLPRGNKRDGVIIGGNLVRWYGGLNSLMVATAVFEVGTPIYLPSMGRMQASESQIQEIKHIPYMGWLQWMQTLDQFKFAIHLNPNTIGGTFSLNCAYLGIPCIGNKNSTPQELCFPNLSVEPADLGTAKQLLHLLKNDENFYNEQSVIARERYTELFHEDAFLQNWDTIKRNQFSELN